MRLVPAGEQIAATSGKTVLARLSTFGCLQRPADLFTFGGPPLQRAKPVLVVRSASLQSVEPTRPQHSAYVDSRTLLSPRAQHVERRTVHVLHGIEGERSPMSEPGPRVAAWFGILSDLLGEPLYEMPHQLILEQLAQTFSVTAIAHNSSDSVGRQQLIMHPHDVLTAFAELDEWLNGRAHELHPIIRWHAVTRDPRPTTMERVPTALVSTRDRRPLLSALTRYELEQQVAISYQLNGASHQAYVLGRARTDFSDDDMVVARHVQRALIGLDRQVSTIANSAASGVPSSMWG